MFLTGILTASLLAGCGSSNNSNSTQPDTSETNPSETDASETDASETDASETDSSSGEKIVLEFFNMKTEITDILEALFAEFESENPNVDIQLNTPTDAATVLTTRVASGETPDIFTHWPKAEFFALVDSGSVMDLTDIGCLDNIQPAAREQWVYNGGEYAATISYNFSGIWYNKGIFNECGIEEFPQTWDALMEVCETLQTAGYTPFVTAGKDPNKTVQQLYVYIPSCLTEAEYDAFKKDFLAGAVDSKSPEYGAALEAMGEKMAKMISYSQDDVLGTDVDSATADFANGKGVMMIDGSWLRPSIKNANSEISCEMAPIPADSAEKTRVAAYPGDFSMCLSSALDGEKKEAAINFVKWMASKEIAQKYAEADGSPSCIEDVAHVAEEFKAVYDTYIVTDSFVLNPDCHWTSAQNNALGSTVQQLYHESDPSALASNIEDAINNN